MVVESWPARGRRASKGGRLDKTSGGAKPGTTESRNSTAGFSSATTNDGGAHPSSSCSSVPGSSRDSTNKPVLPQLAASWPQGPGTDHGGFDSTPSLALIAAAAAAERLPALNPPSCPSTPSQLRGSAFPNRFCTQCGSRLLPGALFCGGCGVSLSAAAVGPSSPNPHDRPPYTVRAAPRQAAVLPPAPASARVRRRQLSPLVSPSVAAAAAPLAASSGLPTDQQLQAVEMRMSKALLAYASKRGVHHGVSNNWTRFFKDVDRDGSGKISFEELDAAVRGQLQAEVSRYELRVLFQRLDSDASGLVTLGEFVRLMYQINLSTWPDLSAADLARVLRQLLDAAERWHHAGGNWFKIFHAVDAEGSGYMSYDELCKYVRAASGLQLSALHLADRDLQGFWKALDSPGSMDVSVYQFMTFLRRCVADLKIKVARPLHRATKYSKQKRGVVESGDRDIPAELAAAAQLGDAELGAVSKRLAQALGTWRAERGIGTATWSVHNPKVWGMLFDFIDTDKTNRLSYAEFEDAMKTRLRVSKHTTDEELKALWRRVDPDGSGEATRLEFGRAVYRLQLLEWPELSVNDLEAIVKVMNTAADRLHRCGGNWYKVFAKADDDGSGQMDYEEMVRFLREPYPCLGIPRGLLDDVGMRGLWRALDKDESACVTLAEFTAFMRHSGKRFAMHKITRYSKMCRGEEAAKAEDLGPAPERSREQLQAMGRALNQAYTTFLTKRGIHGNTAVQYDWALLFRETDKDGSGRLTFTELEAMLRMRLAGRGAEASAGGTVIPGVSFEDLRALWAVLDLDSSGEVTIAEWFQLIYRLEVETWPDDDAAVDQAVFEMNAAVERQYRASGNWYKVFRLIDSDNSGQMGYDELREIVRRPIPCLAIPSKRLPDRALRALWKALDSEFSGKTSMRNFMVLMRRRGGQQGLNFHRSPTRGESRAAVAKGLTLEQRMLVTQALAAQSEKTFAQAYQSWDTPWDGAVSEWRLLSVVRRLLGLREDQFDDDAVHALWRSLHKSESGEVQVSTLLAWGQSEDER